MSWLETLLGKKDEPTYTALSPATGQPVSDDQQAAENDYLRHQQISKDWEQRHAQSLRNGDVATDIPDAVADPDVKATIQRTHDEMIHPAVQVSRPKDLGVGSDYLASIPGAQPAAVAGDSGGPQGAVMKLAMGAGMPSEHKAQLTQALAQKYDPEMAAAKQMAAFRTAKGHLDRGLDTMTQAIVSRGFTRQSAMPQGNAEEEIATANQPVVELQQQRAQALAESKRDPTSDVSRQMQALVKAALPSAKLDNLDHMSADFLEKQFPELTKAVAAESKADPAMNPLRAAQLEATRARTNAILSNQGVQRDRLAQGAARLGLQQDKWGQQKAEKNLPGYEADDPSAPSYTKAEAQKFRSATEGLSNINRIIDEYDNLIAKHGAQWGPTEAKMQADYLRARLVPLITAAEGMGGALTNGKMHLDELQLGPAIDSPAMWINSGGARKVLQNIKADLAAGLQNKAHAMRAHAAQGGSGKVKVSNGKETLLIDPSDLQDAAQDGFHQVR